MQVSCSLLYFTNCFPLKVPLDHSYYCTVFMSLVRQEEEDDSDDDTPLVPEKAISHANALQWTEGLMDYCTWNNKMLPSLISWCCEKFVV
ncbi:hypothetical protein C0J52_08856 [Blattella germanica]|nr:hypothetical protein C0J52_08856 [Blattella germanica]